MRSAIMRGDAARNDLQEVAERAAHTAWLIVSPSLKQVINATGIVIHTNLGRAPLSQSAIEAVSHVAGYSNLEYNLEAGARGSRYTHAVEALRRVTGCEGALVVNNNAAALVLVLAAMSHGREVVVSRGELVEIGGGFRIPDIMLQGGARLVEVGTTNRTYIEDYRAALTENTALLMRIHTSNFRITGFTTSPAPTEIVQLAHEHGLLMVDDVGSGALIDTARYGLTKEPTVQASLQSGADLVLFSGDKLLGGPQCGMICGRKEVVEQLTRHPLARALRVDKITLAALEATLLHYLKGEAESAIPVWRMISMPEAELEGRARCWAEQLSARGLICGVEKGQSAIGGGSLPGETLPTWCVSIEPQEEEGSSPEKSAGRMAALLREATVPVIARVEQGRLLIDPRSVLPGQETLLLEALYSLK